MQRILYKQLLKWKNTETRLPLLLKGARQTGKTYLVEEFGSREFAKCHTFNFLQNPSLAAVFAGDLEPTQVLRDLALYSRQDINPELDLIFFDEIQECPRAITCLKLFAEKLPNSFVVAAGSLLGVKTSRESFPVGKVTRLTLYPMNFEEFLLASGDSHAYEAFMRCDRRLAAHNILWSLFTEFCYVGGMPAVVKKWFDSPVDINTRISAVRPLQLELLEDYHDDFTKHSGKTNSMQLRAVFNNIPIQLAKVIDGSVQRFKFKDPMPNKRSYNELASAITWIETANLAHKVYIIESEPTHPLKALIAENRFKLVLFDVGLLGAMLELNYRDQVNQDYGIQKGYFAENYVAICLVNAGYQTLFSWQQNKAELEFMVHHPEFGIVPIEVKSGRRTKAQSLSSFKDRYKPHRTVKFIGKVGGTDPQNMVIPLYYAERLEEFLRHS